MSTQPVQLGEICQFAYGEALKEENRRGGKVPVYGSNGVVGWHDKSLTRGATIVIGRKGSIGEVNWSSGPCFPIDTTYFVEKTERPCDLRWLYYTLLKLDLTRLNKSAAVPGLNRDDAYEQLIPFPDMREQERIAALLDRADRLRRIRHYALELTDTFLPAAFLELFGETSDGFPARTVDELAANKPHAIRTGPFGSQLLHSEFTDRGIAVLGIDNAVNNEFAWGQRRFITPEKYEQLKRYTVFPGDVIITIMGTCGRCAIVPDDISMAINTKHLCCITLDPHRCLPIYLHGAFLFHPFVIRQRSVAMKGAIMDGLNMEIIKGLQIPFPSLPVQQKFASLVEQVECFRAVQREGLRQSEHLFASLLNEAFSG